MCTERTIRTSAADLDCIQCAHSFCRFPDVSVNLPSAPSAQVPLTWTANQRAHAHLATYAEPHSDPEVFCNTVSEPPHLLACLASNFACSAPQLLPRAAQIV